MSKSDFHIRVNNQAYDTIRFLANIRHVQLAELANKALIEFYEKSATPEEKKAITDLLRIANKNKSLS
jgi:hypothetical protein